MIGNSEKQTTQEAFDGQLRERRGYNSGFKSSTSYRSWLLLLTFVGVRFLLLRDRI